MNAEMFVLFLTVILGILHLFLQATAVTMVRGTKWNMSSRDSAGPALTGVPGRIDRSFDNFKETFPLFLAATVLVLITGRGGSVSQTGAFLYLFCRCVYIPLYVFNVTGIRSLVWAASMLGIVLMLLQLLVSS